MSSATFLQPYAAKQQVGSVGDKVLDAIKRLGLSPRQMELNELWGWYRCQHYDARRVDWDGRERTVGVDHEAIATAGFIPPGFYDAGGNNLPLKYRRPSAPYALPKVIVDRFTGLLFSERRHPQLRCQGDPDTEDFVEAMAEVGRLWPLMILARAYGGAMGSVAVGFQFVNGKPVFEVHDPRWCIPEFADRLELRLSRIEKRYQYPVEKRDPEGKWIEEPYWYRRVIDEDSDVLYDPTPVPEDGSEPVWEEDRRVDHGLGFCPVVWIQNLPVQDSVDGDPDCHGIFDMVEQMDTLIAQGGRGVSANCEPTLKIITDAPMSDVQKGTGNAIKLPMGSQADYLEISGASATAAFTSVDKLRAFALEVAQCVLDHPDSTQRTAQEIERVYSSMLSKADVLREQYGQKGVLAVVELALKAARTLGTPKVGENGIQRSKIVLPPKVVEKGEGEPPELVERKLGNGRVPVTLQWGDYFPPTQQDTLNVVTAASKAKDAGLIDREHAANAVAPHFHVESVTQMLDKIEKEKKEEQDRIEQGILATGGGGKLPGW